MFADGDAANYDTANCPAAGELVGPAILNLSVKSFLKFRCIAAMTFGSVCSPIYLLPYIFCQPHLFAVLNSHPSKTQSSKTHVSNGVRRTGRPR
jgi:hypothetical protein